MENIFTNIYENCDWGNNKHNNYNGSSGRGSDVDYNIETYVPFLKKYISDNNIKNIVDLGCGDFRCGPLIYDDLDISYTGYDTYNKVVLNNQKNHLQPKYNFVHLDFFNNKKDISDGDLCILKDVIQHWNLDSIYTFLDYLVENKKFKYILICNCCNQTQDNTDTYNGGVRTLNCNFLPLSKYHANEVYRYHTKQVSIIKIN